MIYEISSDLLLFSTRDCDKHAGKAKLYSVHVAIIHDIYIYKYSLHLAGQKLRQNFVITYTHFPMKRKEKNSKDIADPLEILRINISRSVLNFYKKR